MSNYDDSSLAVLPRPIREPASDFHHHATFEENWEAVSGDFFAKPQPKQADTSKLSALFEEYNESTPYRPSKPQIPPPKAKKNHMQQFLENSVLPLEKTATDFIANQEEWISWMCNMMEGLSDTILEHIKTSAEKLKSTSTWSTLSKVATGVLASFSLLLGVSLVATGAGSLVGGLLIASGTLALGNLICEETRAWDWVADKLSGGNTELRSQLRTWIPATINILSLIAGAIGSTWALLTQAFNPIYQFLLFGNNLTQIGQSIAGMGKGVTQYHYLMTDAERDRMQNNYEQSNNDLDELLNALRSVAKAQEVCVSSAKASLSSYTNAVNLKEYEA